MNPVTVITPYLLGHDAHELKRLQEQGRILAAPTEAFLTMAGIAPGMRVLDLGSGAGDVAFQIARRIGPTGSVLGIDNSPVAVTRARRRADQDKVGNVTFDQGDIRTLEPGDLGGPFDAVVGRLVLLYVADPAGVVRRFAGALRPGGVLLTMEYDMTASGSVPSLPLVTRSLEWILGAFESAGHDPALGARLGAVLSAAGFAEPAALGLQKYLLAEDPAGPRLLAETVRTLLPVIERAGIASTEEVSIDSLAERIAGAARAAQAICKPPALVGAWARAASVLG